MDTVPVLVRSSSVQPTVSLFFMVKGDYDPNLSTGEYSRVAQYNYSTLTAVKLKLVNGRRKLRTIITAISISNGSCYAV
jgi:hypothetical protein